MEFNYRETTRDLQTRIDIHNKFGSKDLEKWTLDLLDLPKNYMNILDIGCGTGKQCFSFHNYLKDNANIIGGDVSSELINYALQENAKIGNPITFTELDFNDYLPYNNNQFDLISCCFAIYYAENIPFTLGEMHRVLKPGGCLLISGPSPQKNKRLYYDLIRKATGRGIQDFGSMPYDSKILSFMNAHFSKVEVHTFENPLIFETVEPFMSYIRASLSEERKQSSDFFKEIGEFESIIAQIDEVARRFLLQEGKLIMTKVVNCYIATK
jgi:ubiquinone/menaquinone biosynthesis C-methylase UbiE